MKFIEQLEAIRAEFETQLPALLLAESLDDFDEYLKRTPKRSDDLELCVYLGEGADSTDDDSRSFIVQAQLPSKQSDIQVQYHDVIYQAIQDFITPELIEMTNRQNIGYDLWPLDDQGNGGFIYYFLEFNSELVDCD